MNPTPIAISEVSPASATPAPLFRPLSELSVNRKRAFKGNRASPDSPFITDGNVLLLKSACTARFLKSKAVVECKYCMSPVDSTIKRVFYEVVNDNIVVAKLIGYEHVMAVGNFEDNDLPMACLVTKQGKVVVLHGDKLRFIQQQTGADSILVSPAQPDRYPVVLLKGEKPVAVLMSFFNVNVNADFQKRVNAAAE